MGITQTGRLLDFDEAADLRRRRGGEVSDIVIRRAEWLRPDERALLHAIYGDGMTASRVAELSALDARVVRRRVRQLVYRCLSELFVFVLREREGWSTRRRQVATACVLHGRSMRDAARELGVSLHTVRREMEAVRALNGARR